MVFNLMINSQLGMERSVLNYVLCNFDACVAKVLVVLWRACSF